MALDSLAMIAPVSSNLDAAAPPVHMMGARVNFLTQSAEWKYGPLIFWVMHLRGRGGEGPVEVGENKKCSWLPFKVESYDTVGDYYEGCVA